MKPFSIAGIEIKNRYVSAPLAGYSDYARRRINYDYGAGLLYTERESCEAIRHNSRISKKELNVTRKDKAEDQGHSRAFYRALHSRCAARGAHAGSGDLRASGHR